MTNEKNDINNQKYKMTYSKCYVTYEELNLENNTNKTKEEEINLEI